eukprot:118319_1
MSILFLSMLCKSHRYLRQAQFLFITNIGIIICTLSCITCTSIDTYHSYVSYYYNKPMLNNKFRDLKFAANISYFTASNLLNLILFCRVYFTFNNTCFQLSKQLVLFFIIQMCIEVLSSMAYCSLTVIFANNESKQDNYAYYITIITMSDEMILSCFLLYLFSKKLQQLIINTSNLDHGYIGYDPQSPKMTSAQSVDLSEHSMRLLKVICRHTVLSGFAILFNQIMYIVGWFSLNQNGGFEQNIYLSQLIYELRALGLIGIVACLYLSLKYNKNMYYKLCNLCDIYCYKCCVWCIEKDIRNALSNVQHT